MQLFDLYQQMETYGSDSTDQTRSPQNSYRRMDREERPALQDGSLEKLLNQKRTAYKGSLNTFFGQVYERVNRWRAEMQNNVRAQQERNSQSPIKLLNPETSHFAFGDQQAQLPIFSNQKKIKRNRGGFIKHHQPEEARRRRDAIEFATHDKKSPPKKTPKKSSEIRPIPLAGDEKAPVDEPGDVVGDKKFDFGQVSIYNVFPPNPSHWRDEKEIAAILKRNDRPVEKRQSAPAAASKLQSLPKKKNTSMDRKGRPPSPIILNTNYQRILADFDPVIKRGVTPARNGLYRIK